MKKLALLLLTTISLAQPIQFPQDVPDINMYNAMLEIVDTNNDGVMIYPDEFQGLQYVYLLDKNIYDATGAEYFLDAIVIDLSRNNIMEFPPNIENITSLLALGLAENRFRGPLHIPAFDNMYMIALEENAITTLTIDGDIRSSLYLSWNNIRSMDWIANINIGADIIIDNNLLGSECTDWNDCSNTERNCEFVKEYRDQYDLLLGKRQRNGSLPCAFPRAMPSREEK